jgi:H+/Na+-translocating ferredoxin:NAD+ oxidoreductase subunit G
MPRLLIALLLALLALLAFSRDARAAICVWRKPDTDIQRFFPGAESYRTDLKPVGSRRAAIERALGARLDPDESDFKFYRILAGSRRVGTVLTHLGKGRYGAIEVVIALDPAGAVKGVRLQVIREPNDIKRQLTGDSFLAQFNGKRAGDLIQVGRDIRPVPGADQSSETIAFSVKKMLVVHAELDH